MLKKTINGKTTTFTFDGANQLVSSTVDGVTTRYTYDAAGWLVKEGNKTYRYGYLDKVMSVSDGKQKLTYDYHADGQIASANYGNGKTEEFLWDGLAIVRRGDEHFVNEPYVGNAPKKLRFEGKPRAQRSARRARKGPRGNPVVSSNGTSYFNDLLGTTVCSKSNGKYSVAALTAFGERLDNVDSTSPAIRSLGEGWFTGKPYVEGLGHVFLMRNYRAGLAKWQTADPLGYPDGWNQLVYCNNGVTSAVDLWGCNEHKIEAKDGVTEIGYTSVHGFGCWYLLDATCSGTYEALNITFTITRKAGSQSAFNDEAQLELPNIGNVYDACARYSGFSSKTENLKRTPNKRKDINELTVEFDWVFEYTATMHYTYEATDPVTGEKQIIDGVMDVPQSIKKHVVLNCYHRKMGE